MRCVGVRKLSGEVRSPLGLTPPLQRLRSSSHTTLAAKTAELPVSVNFRNKAGWFASVGRQKQSGDASHNIAASRATFEGAQTKHSAPSYVVAHCNEISLKVKRPSAFDCDHSPVGFPSPFNARIGMNFNNDCTSLSNGPHRRLTHQYRHSRRTDT